MYENLLKENVRIEIRTSPESRIGLPSRIEDVRGRTILAAFPTRQGALVPLHIGQKIYVDFSVKDDSYNFETTVLARRREPIPIFEMAMPETINKIQRRNYVRFRVTVPLKFRVLQCEDDLLCNVPESEMMDGATVDVSGGGSQFTTKHEVEAGQMLEVHMMLPNRKPLALVVKVIRAVPDGLGNARKFTVASMFDRIKENQRDVIISFIFEKQRELRKKGLL